MNFTITNVGTNPARIWKHINVTDESGGLHPESEWDEDPQNSINDISTVLGYDMKVNDSYLIRVRGRRGRGLREQHVDFPWHA